MERRFVWVLGLLLLAPSSPIFLRVAAIPTSATPYVALADALPIFPAINTRSAVWSGTQAYTFDGSELITRYDPETNTASVLSVQLPSHRQYMTSTWFAGRAYLVGGIGPVSYRNEILVFDPVAETVTLSPAALPYGVTGAAVVSTADKIYIIGGDALSGTTSNIVEFDPVAETATQLSLHLPGSLRDTTAIWDGSAIYLFGGDSGVAPAFFYGRQILRFVPPHGTNPGSVTILAAALPETTRNAASFWDGTRAFVLGGGVTNSRTISMFDPATQALTSWPTNLPYPLWMVAAVYDAGRDCAYVLGGYTSSTAGSIRRDVMAFGGPACPGATLPPDQDTDMDGVPDVSDNCILVPNLLQANADGDGLGDACDPDIDGDGIANADDDCSQNFDPDQVDLDADLQGDACDGDDDGDLVPDVVDNCPRLANPAQEDFDGNGLGDACDTGRPRLQSLPPLPEPAPPLAEPLFLPPIAVPTASVACSSTRVVLDGFGSNDSDGAIVAWEWDLGNGERVSSPLLVHDFGGFANRTVGLTVTDDTGLSARREISVRLGPCPPSPENAQRAPVVQAAETRPLQAAIAPPFAPLEVASSSTAPVPQGSAAPNLAPVPKHSRDAAGPEYLIIGMLALAAAGLRRRFF